MPIDRKTNVSGVPLGDMVLEEARRKGAKQPTLADSSDGSLVVMDTDDGRCWEAVSARIDLALSRKAGKAEGTVTGHKVTLRRITGS